MDNPFYDFQVLDEAQQFDFESVNKQRTIKKIVRYSATNIENLYNLSLVDILPDGLESDTSVSDNQDMKTVLATVFQTFFVF